MKKRLKKKVEKMRRKDMKRRINRVRTMEAEEHVEESKRS